MNGYGQHCPVAKAAELIDRRWTLLVLRELTVGSTRFNELHRGVPRMSRTQLSTRLRELADDGLVVRREGGDGPRYELTEAGQAFRPVIEALGQWGIRWVDSLTDADVDPALLMWDVHRRIDLDTVPDGRTVIGVRFPDLDPPVRDWWLVVTPTDVDVCEDDPGYETDLQVEAPAQVFARVWRGDLGWNEAVRDDTVRVAGPPSLRRQLPDWLQFSHFADDNPRTAQRRRSGTRP